MIHYAKLAKSERLQRLLILLRDGQWHTTRDIIEAAQICAVNTAVVELRRNGFEIKCRCIGKGRFEYRMPPMMGVSETLDPAESPPREATLV